MQAMKIEVGSYDCVMCKRTDWTPSYGLTGSYRLTLSC